MNLFYTDLTKMINFVQAKVNGVDLRKLKTKRPVTIARDYRPGPVSVERQRCELCTAHFADAVELWEHVRADHGDEDRLQCMAPGCGRWFARLSVSFDHWADHLEAGAPWGFNVVDACELCGRVCRDRAALRAHARTRHPGARDATCAVCCRFFGCAAKLGDHVAMAHEPKHAGGRVGPYRNRKRAVQCYMCCSSV